MGRGRSSPTARTIRAVAAAVVREVSRAERERRLLERSGSIGQLLAQTATEFEETTAVILRQVGYRLTRVGKAGDLGADLVGTDAYGRSVIVQCKRYAPGNKVGSPALQSFIGMCATHHRADVGIFVTTSTYTTSAAALAQQHGILLWDGDQLADLVHRAQERPYAL